MTKEFPQEEATIPGKPILSYFRRLFVAADQLLNVVFGLLAAWMLMREPPPASPGEDPTGRTRR